MEHESFENEEIAALLNEHFVSIKVDREERPDLDQIYMQALHVYFQMVGSPQGGGWPLSMFLTPELQPFLGGTYWPPEGRYGRPGFADVLRQVAQFWREHREQVVEQAGRLTEFLQQTRRLRAASRCRSTSWPVHGGHWNVTSTRGTAVSAERRSFPIRSICGCSCASGTASAIRNCSKWSRSRWKRWPPAASTIILAAGSRAMQSIERWLVPHFEKMLYDNALLSQAYVEAYQATGNEEFARVARETYEYVLRDMTHAEGGFFSAQDADSEGEEGKYYVWTPAEVEALLGPEVAKTFCYVYDVSRRGQLRGSHHPQPAQNARSMRADPQAR